MHTLKKIVNKLQTIKLYFYSHPKITKYCLLSMSFFMEETAFADDGIIPAPSADDDPTQGHDWMDIIVNIFKTKAGPLLIYGGSLLFLCMAAFEVLKGYKKYQETDDFGKFKMSLVVGAIFLVICGGLFFMGQHILTKWVSSS